MATEEGGGYMHFHCAPDSIAFDKECKKLLNEFIGLMY